MKLADMSEADHEEFDENHDGTLGLDCGMSEDGQCQYAGTEECDECPFWEDVGE